MGLLQKFGGRNECACGGMRWCNNNNNNDTGSTTFHSPTTPRVESGSGEKCRRWENRGEKQGGKQRGEQGKMNSIYFYLM